MTLQCVWKPSGWRCDAGSGKTTLQTGDVLTLQIGKIQILGFQNLTSNTCFAAILGDGSVVTCESANHGGNSLAVQDQLKDVQQIQATNFAFAAILGDMSVVTWGT